MTPLKNLFINTLYNPGSEQHYRSEDFDLSFVAFNQRLYFILAQGEKNCLSGNAAESAPGVLTFQLDVHKSAWLKDAAKKQTPIENHESAALALMEEKFSFMLPYKIQRGRQP